jgi:hypothetical protein
VTYLVGNVIVASDYLTFRGINAPNVAYSDDTTATKSLAALIGVGYGTRGAGVTSTQLPLPGNTSVVGTTAWNNLVSALTVYNSRGQLNLNLPTPVTVGSLVKAQDGSNSRASIQSTIESIDADRFKLDISQSTYTFQLTSKTTTQWTNGVYHEFTVDFGTEDAARYYFNNGGEIQMNASRTGGSNTHINVALTNMLAAIKTVKLRAVDTTYTGTNGVLAGIGYFGLTSRYKILFSHSGLLDQAIGYNFPDISYNIQARRENYVGVNGGNGSLIRIRVNMSLASYYTEIIDGTTQSVIASVRSTGVIPVPSPVFRTILDI